jgi:hypothetical protein
MICPMERRTLLKGLGMLLAAPLIKVPDMRIVLPEVIPMTGERLFANVRELKAYDIERDAFVYRWDLLCIEKGLPLQLHVDFRADEKTLEMARNSATDVLKAALVHRNIDWKTIHAPPLPNGWLTS